MKKYTIVILTPDCFMDTDMTVLKHLSKEYRIVWYYINKGRLATPQYGRKAAQDYADKYGIELHVLDNKPEFKSFKNFKFYFDLAKEFNNINPDLIYHTNTTPYWTLAIMLFQRNRNIIMGIHDVAIHSYDFSISQFISKFTWRLSLKVNRNFITYSPNQHNLLLSKYHLESSMVGMSYKDFGMSNRTVEPITNGIKLLFFGKIHKYKGLDLLISSLEKLRAEGINNITLTIAGTGASWSTCEALIKTKEMFNLQTRFIDNSEIPDLMCSNHFLILPYRDATQSGPLATAVAYELPVIAPAFGCFIETYDNDSAILYKQGELEKALRKISTINQKVYDSMKCACKKIKELNSEEEIALNYKNAFYSLLEKK